MENHADLLVIFGITGDLARRMTFRALYRLERRGLIQGRWVERAGVRRRRFYRLTAQGQQTLDAQRRSWKTFFAALNRVARIRHA